MSGFFGNLKKVFGKFSKKVEDVKSEKEEVIEELKTAAKEQLAETPPKYFIETSEEASEEDIVKKVAIKEGLKPIVKGPVLPKIEQVQKAVELEIKTEPKIELKPEPVIEEIKVAAPVPEKKGFFSRIALPILEKKISESDFEKLFEETELSLLENNVAFEVVDKLKQDLKLELVDKSIPRGKVEDVVAETLYHSLTELFIPAEQDFLARVKQKKPFVICFVGVNGSGKTTTIAKVAKFLKDNGVEPVLAAGDTFRAAAIDQLQLHADALGVKIIKHDYGADAAAVAFDAIKHAESKGRGAVLIDTAGRTNANANLMEELKKVVRVAKPDMKIFVGESITGNDCVEQARNFDEAVDIDGIILSKADVDDKGGAALSISYVTKKPILFLGTGQEYSDLKVFNAEDIVSGLTD